MRMAAIDIGSNAIRMQVFERAGGENIVAINTLRKPVRLGADVFHNGRILPESFDAALETMREFKAVIDKSGVTNVSAIATSAVRESANGQALIERMQRDTGIDVQTISGSEEARLIITAVLDKMPLKKFNAFHIEVGGGSVEVSLIKKGSIQFSLTHKLGAVRLMEVLNTYSDSGGKFKDYIKEYINITNKRVQSSLGGKKVDRFVATGGNIDSAIWLLAQTHWAEVSVENGVSKISFDALLEVVKRLTATSYRDRVEKFQIRPDRADVILPAALVYAGFAEALGVKWIYAPGVGVRDGLAIDMFRKGEVPHQKEKHRQIISAVKALGEKYDFNRLHSEVVAEYSLELFDALKEMHGLGEKERLLLEVASLLHDIGYFVNTARHHKHSYYLISESDIAGLNPRDLMIVANIARYHRKAMPKEQHENFRVLPQKEKEIILKLAAILRIGDALDRDRAGVKAPLAIELNKRNLVLTLSPARNRLLESWAMNSKGELFTEFFGYNIVVK